MLSIVSSSSCYMDQKMVTCQSSNMVLRTLADQYVDHDAKHVLMAYCPWNRWKWQIILVSAGPKEQTRPWRFLTGGHINIITYKRCL